MKIPHGTWITKNHDLYTKWREAGDKLAVEYGIYIEIGITEHNGCSYIEELFYKVEDHKVGSVKELRKMLRNKAFL